MAIQFPSSQFPVLQTERLILRKLVAEDAGGLMAIRNNEEINRYLDRPSNHTLTDIAQFIAARTADIETGGSGVYWCIELKATGKLIGTICYWNIDYEAETTEIGYELLPDMQGMGIMNEAIPAVIDYGFNTMKLLVITGYTLQSNSSSVKLLERKGFTCLKNEDGLLMFTRNTPL